MFTGIVQSVGEITSLNRSDEGIGLTVDTKLDDPTKLAIGDSVAINGACMTVIERRGSEVDVFVSVRSLSDTGFSSMNVGHAVNIETALTLSEPLGGHIVTGHIDGLARCVSLTQSGASVLLEVSVEHTLGINQFIAPQGSVALDGVSLTVKDVHDSDSTTEFTVNIIPHTLSVTTLKDVIVGTSMHIEVDMLARYAGRITEYLNKGH